MLGDLKGEGEGEREGGRGRERGRGEGGRKGGGRERGRGEGGRKGGGRERGRGEGERESRVAQTTTGCVSDYSKSTSLLWRFVGDGSPFTPEAGQTRM